MFTGPAFPAGTGVFCGVGGQVPLESKWGSAYTLDILQSGAAPALAREPDRLFGKFCRCPQGQGPDLPRGGRLSQNPPCSLVHERARQGPRDHWVRPILRCGWGNQDPVRVGDGQEGQEASALNSPCLSRDAGDCPGHGLVLGQPRARGRVQNPREPVTGGAQAEGQTVRVWSAGRWGRNTFPGGGGSM